VPVHAMGALEELLKVVVSDDDSVYREADGTPQAVPTADPIPELKRVLRGDAELGRRGGVSAERDEMFRDVSPVLGVVEEQRAGGMVMVSWVVNVLATINRVRSGSQRRRVSARCRRCWRQCVGR
jgi:hypothetical protein